MSGRLRIHQEINEMPGLIHGPSSFNLHLFLQHEFVLFNQTIVTKIEIYDGQVINEFIVNLVPSHPKKGNRRCQLMPKRVICGGVILHN